MTSISDAAVFSFGGPSDYGAGTITLFIEEDAVCIVTSDFEATAQVNAHQPDDLRALAHRLLEEASLLQDRLDIAAGIGGDQ